MLLDDRERLLDILMASRQVIELSASMKREDLDVGYKNAYALAYALQIIGEAASNLTREFREANLHIPWSKITAMRHRLVHGYGKLDMNVIWDTTQEDVYPLMIAVQEIIDKG